MTDASLVLDVRSERPASPTQIHPDSVVFGFNELGTYRIHRPTSDDQLLIDDELLEIDDGEWVW